MNYSILAAEIAQPQYAGMTDAEIAAVLNTPGPASRQLVAIERLQAAAMEISVYVALRTAIATPETPPQLLAICQSALDLVNARFSFVDLDNPAAQQMFGALQQAGIINEQQAAAIDALAVVAGVSRAQVLGLGDVSEADVAAARDWQEYEQLIARVQAGAAIAVGWLYQQRDAGAAVPEWSAVLERM